MDRTQRLRVLQGLALGDALGAGTEFRKPDEIAASCGKVTGFVPGGVMGFAPGEFTDDTQTTLCVLRAYRAGAETRLLLPEVASELQRWVHSGPRDVGMLTCRAVRGFRDGGLAAGLQAWRDSGYASAGNGGLMRAAAPIVAGVAQRDLDQHAILLGALTHADPRSLVACLVFSRALTALAAGAPPQEAWNAAAAHADDHPIAEVVRAAFGAKWGAEVRSHVPTAHALVCERVALGLGGDAGSQSGYVLDTLQAAVCATLGHDFTAALFTIVARGNDSDTAGAVAGALLAAEGCDLPPGLLQQVHSRHRWEGWDPSWDYSALEHFVD